MSIRLTHPSQIFSPCHIYIPGDLSFQTIYSYSPINSHSPPCTHQSNPSAICCYVYIQPQWYVTNTLTILWDHSASSGCLFISYIHPRCWVTSDGEPYLDLMHVYINNAVVFSVLFQHILTLYCRFIWTSWSILKNAQLYCGGTHIPCGYWNMDKWAAPILLLVKREWSNYEVKTHHHGRTG